MLTVDGVVADDAERRAIQDRVAVGAGERRFHDLHGDGVGAAGEDDLTGQEERVPLAEAVAGREILDQIGAGAVVAEALVERVGIAVDEVLDGDPRAEGGIRLRLEREGE